MSDVEELLNLTLHPFPSSQRIKNPAGSDYLIAELECPTCLALDNFYSMERNGIFDAIYCKGNQPPECHHPNGHSHLISCAGVIEPHLHVGCKICNNHFLLSLPEKK